MATREDQRIFAEQKVPKIQEPQPLREDEWRPRWHVLRDHDAFPGEDLGKVPVSQLAQAKAFCEKKGLAGLVLFGGVAYLRAQQSVEVLCNAASPQKGAELLLRPDPLLHRPEKATARLRVAVLATQDEFDETSLFDVGMVSSTGNGRRYAAQALLRSIAQSEDFELTAVLVYDWKNETGHWALPSEGPQHVTLNIRGGQPVSAWRGSMGQLLGACAGDLAVDVAVSIQSRRTCLELMLRSIRAKKYVAMGHDYNLPFGPWGMEVEPEMLALHRVLIQDSRMTMFCTSQHLVDFVHRFSQGRVKTRLCYCADYGYFDSEDLPLANEPRYVTLISPSPAKGLAILLRLALMLPDVEFLCVSTGWTKTLHEVQLRAHPNVKVVPGSDDLDTVYQQTAVLLMPSLWQESFGLVAVEAQLRGLCVVSTGSYGLKEANFLEELQVTPVTLVHDSRTREMLRGLTLAEAEERLDPGRPRKEGQDHIHFAHTLIATEEEAKGFAEKIRFLMANAAERARLGLLARARAREHVRARRGGFAESLKELLAEGSIETAPVHE
ncbi:Hypothetical protein (Fragment), partial [Durusdinium trenchii]